jgi:hypothetical protein
MESTQGVQPALYIMGDVHGQYERLSRLLHANGLIDADQRWTGGEAHLWFIGDYFDRGPDGIACIELIMSLQEQAGEQVGALVGNHDVMILAADRFGSIPSPSTGITFFSDWLRNGGNIADLDALDTIHIDWLACLPSAALVQDNLLLHADALFYTNYGLDIETLNQAIQKVMQHGTPAAFDQLLEVFSQRRAFIGQQGQVNLRGMLNMYGGKRLIHGHTPISKVTGELARSITMAHVYQDGACVNIDGGMYLGGPGFLYVAK